MFYVLLYVVLQTVTVIPMSLAVVFVLYEMQEEALGFNSEMPSSEDITKEQTTLHEMHLIDLSKSLLKKQRLTTRFL